MRDSLLHKEAFQLTALLHLVGEVEKLWLTTLVVSHTTCPFRESLHVIWRWNYVFPGSKISHNFSNMFARDRIEWNCSCSHKERHTSRLMNSKTHSMCRHPKQCGDYLHLRLYSTKLQYLDWICTYLISTQFILLRVVKSWLYTKVGLVPNSRNGVSLITIMLEHGGLCILTMTSTN